MMIQINLQLTCNIFVMEHLPIFLLQLYSSETQKLWSTKCFRWASYEIGIHKLVALSTVINWNSDELELSRKSTFFEICILSDNNGSLYPFMVWNTIFFCSNDKIRSLLNDNSFSPILGYFAMPRCNNIRIYAPFYDPWLSFLAQNIDIPIKLMRFGTVG